MPEMEDVGNPEELKSVDAAVVRALRMGERTLSKVIEVRNPCPVVTFWQGQRAHTRTFETEEQAENFACDVVDAHVWTRTKDHVLVV